MKHVIVPAREVPIADLLVESIDQLRMVTLALHADRALLTDDNIEPMVDMLWETQDRLRTVFNAMLEA